VYRARPGWPALAWRVTVSSAVMALAVAVGLEAAGDWFVMSSLLRVGALAALVVGGAAVYFLACHLTGLRASELRAQSTA
jgi:putative peptidoglycan lipid II flippase